MEGFGVFIALLLTVAAVLYARSKGYRRARGCELGGVCCGIAHKTGAPENGVKIIAVLLLLFTGGWALIAYIFAWLCWDKE